MLSEKETLLRAKMYLEKLSRGIDPLTDAPIPENDTVRKERIAKCLSFSAEALGKAAEKTNLPPAKKAKKPPFSLSSEQLSEYEINTPLPITEIKDRLNRLTDEKTLKLKSSSVTGWLIDNGYLTHNADPELKPRFLPTDKGRNTGIFIETRHGIHGDYGVIIYDSNAQQLILDNLTEIAKQNVKKSDGKTSPIFSDSKVPTMPSSASSTDKGRIVELYNHGSSIAAIAHILKIDYKVIKNCLIEAGVLRVN